MLPAYTPANTEKFVNDLATETFLRLWSYSNPYKLQRAAKKGDGKELCDLLIIFENNIIIISEKGAPHSAASVDLSWTRWFNKKVFRSLKQVQGAERWIREFPDRIFQDKECTQRLYVDFETEKDLVFHRVCVAHGINQLCLHMLPERGGRLKIKPRITGSAHIDTKHPCYEPFAIGDICPEENYTHVFDFFTLVNIIRQVDTIPDFVNYLSQRADFIRSGHLLSVIGEENLLSDYLRNTDSKGKHCFRSAKNSFYPRLIPDGSYHELINDSRYINEKNRQRLSYAWDDLIRRLIDNHFNKTDVQVIGDRPNLSDLELALREMARMSRFERGVLTDAHFQVLNNTSIKKRGFRMIGDPNGEDFGGVGFLFFVMSPRNPLFADKTYDEYRQARILYLDLYARAVLQKLSHMQKIVGIAREPLNHDGVSEDLIYVEQHDWSREDIEKTQEHCKKLGILGVFSPQRVNVEEYPSGKDYSITFPISE